MSRLWRSRGGSSRPIGTFAPAPAPIAAWGGSRWRLALHRRPESCDQIGREWYHVQQCIGYQSDDEQAAELPVVKKGHGGKPGRPGRVPGGRRSGRGLLSNLITLRACLKAKNTISMTGVKMADEHQVQDDCVDRLRSCLVSAKRTAFSHPHGECADAAFLVVIPLVDMLAHIDAGHAQPVRHPCKHHVPVPNA